MAPPDSRFIFRVEHLEKVAHFLPLRLTALGFEAMVNQDIKISGGESKTFNVRFYCNKPFLTRSWGIVGNALGYLRRGGTSIRWTRGWRIFLKWRTDRPYKKTWWRHQMETFSALVALCEGKPPVTGGFPLQRPVTQSFDVFFDLRLNKRWSKLSWRRWFETPSRSLWRHYNGGSYHTLRGQQGNFFDISCSLTKLFY